MFEAIPTGTAWAGMAWCAVLAAAVLVLLASLLRIHPERSGVLLAARAALVASLGGGTAMIVGLLVVIQT